MARRPLTDAEVERVRELHNQGLSRNQIAASIGRSWSSVTKLARIAGVKFDRAAPKAAIEARVIDGKVRRRGIIERPSGGSSRNIRCSTPTLNRAAGCAGKAPSTGRSRVTGPASRSSC